MPAATAPARRAATSLPAGGEKGPAAPSELEAPGEALAALRLRARYDAAEPALHHAALTSADPLAFLEAAVEAMGRTAGATLARALLADADDAPLVTVAVWAAEGAAPPEPVELEPAAVEAGRGPEAFTDLRCGHAAVLAPFGDDARAGAFLLERGGATPWEADERDALARLVRLFESLWARAASEARLRLTLADLEDGLFSFGYGSDGSRRYALATPQFEAIAGCAAADLLARSDGAPASLGWATLVHPDDVERFAAHEAALQSGEASRLAYRLRRPADGEVRWVREAATPGRSSSGRPIVGGLLSDVTEAKRAEASLLQAKQAAERASHAKTHFLATISHEIRSPLGAVRGFAELLVEEVAELEAAGTELPPQIPEFAGVIAQNTRRALHLVHRLFDLSRLETGSLSLQSVPVELHPAVERVLARYRPEAEAKGLYVWFDRAEADPVLLADPERVEEVVEHLVSNAVKFTDAGGVTVSTRLSAEGDEPAVHLVVEDTGAGIASEFLAGLFEPFAQEDYRFNRAHDGAGLGLAVTKRLLDGMGGAISVESEKGAGSRFEVVFTSDE